MNDEDQILSNHDYRRRIEWGAQVFNVVAQTVLYGCLIFAVLYLAGHHLAPAFQGVR